MFEEPGNSASKMPRKTASTELGKMPFYGNIRYCSWHKISATGLEVDQSKVSIIKTLAPPTTVKGVRSFLGHAGFYRRFIKDFSKIARPLCRLLEKDTRFNFDDSCKAAFEEIKIKLVQAPIMAAP